ncbi:MAG: DUF1592 domain-containing protein [Myxococcales bacterium]
MALASVLAVGCTGLAGSDTGPGAGAAPPGVPGGGASPLATAGASASTAGQNAGGGASSAASDPGRVTIRRLNRVEYDNTVRDLLGTAQTPGAATFPNDAPQIGFDNDGDLQTLSPVQFNLYVQAAQALATEALKAGSPQRAKLVTCDLASGPDCAKALITSFGLRAFRRPLTDSEVSNYVALLDSASKAGANAEEQFQTVVQAILSSPNFLFRPELDPDPTSLTPHVLAPYEMASRLSYMIYRSMPDEALFTAASNNALSQPAEIQAQVERMIADPKGVLAPTFATMWLGTSAVSTQSFDAALFPEFNASLAASMSGEVIAFFNEFLQQNEPVTQLLTADFSYLDANLAKLYGVAAPTSSGLTRTPLGTPQRAGLLTMAGVLSVTSLPTRTSVVKRGAWVLGQLLCAPPPAPPPDVPAFPEDVKSGTQKEVLAMHRANPTCATCHNSMDNIGLAMENYDAVGAYRTMDNGVAVDASGMFTGALAEPSGAQGPAFTGAVALAAAVAADPRFPTCVAQNALSYSIGRTILPSDAPYVALIAKGASGTLGVRDILMNVAASDTFRMRRGEM